MYLQNVNIAENYIINGSYDSAIVSYQAAFNLHKPLAVDIYNAFLVAKESKDRFAAEQFLWKLAGKGVGRSFFEKNRYINSYRNNSNWKKWLSKADSEKMKIRIANQEVISRIERISYSAENLYRIWVKSLEGKTGTKETDFELRLDEQNNSLIDSLLSIINQFGYPSEERIGVRIVNDTNILSEPVFSKIILRGYSKPNGIGGGTFDEILKNAIDSGFIKPFFFARMHDYKHYQNYTPYGTSFFTGLGGKIYYSDKDDISQIEENRRQIGLSSLLEYAKIVQYTLLNKGSSFIFDALFTIQDRLLDTEKDQLEYIQNHKEYVPANFE
ncbi:hypothetical protein [Sphingobacterium detergens]|uniref:hypothetical protein n=1 Tax=Sphingobacterium detergens TaxID=1145106 RepID=UPI000E772D5B|nr:hypothetical protein [Sphingobacterium detergens]